MRSPTQLSGGWSRMVASGVPTKGILLSLCGALGSRTLLERSGELRVSRDDSP